MTRRAIAVLSLLALAACYGRVAAYAASPSADAHACCRGEMPSEPSPAPSLSACCATPAATSTVSVVRAPIFLVAVPLSAPRPLSAAVAATLEIRSAAPPGPQTFRASVPARAPPLG